MVAFQLVYILILNGDQDRLKLSRKKMSAKQTICCHTDSGNQFPPKIRLTSLDYNTIRQRGKGG